MDLLSGQNLSDLVLDPSWSLFMGDHRAGSSGSTATSHGSSGPVTGKRAAHHAVEQPVAAPYAGRRAARPEPVRPVQPAEHLPYAGRRVAGRNPIVPIVEPVVAPTLGRRIALDPELAGQPCDVVGHLLAPSPASAGTTYVGRRMAVPALLAEPALTPAPVEVVAAVEVVEPVEVAPAVEPVESVAPVEVPEPVEVVRAVEPVEVLEPVEVPEPVAPVEVAEAVEAPAHQPAAKPRSSRASGRRAATRRTRVPSLPLLAGVAVLAVSAGGALQAVHPGLGADAKLSPAGVLAGDHSVGSASLLNGRGAVVSRSADRLQAAANAEAKTRDATLSAFALQAQKKSAQIQLHQWVLPITPGTYDLTARFGQYSALWSNFHTGLDFAAPTGTPIMAVAAGTITSVEYSGAYGNRTIELLPDGTELWYCHQNDFGTTVGAKVKAGQVIGYVGSTGNVTGPHLHLEVHPGGGDPVDPYPVLVDHGLYPGPPA